MKQVKCININNNERCLNEGCTHYIRYYANIMIMVRVIILPNSRLLRFCGLSA